MPTLTIPQLEQVSLLARLSRERADYATKQLLVQTKVEKAVYDTHIKTLDAILAKLSD